MNTLKWIALGGLAAVAVWLAFRAKQSQQQANFADGTTSWGVQKAIMQNLCTEPKTCYAIPGGGVFFPGKNR